MIAKSLLLVDDDESLLELLGDYLRRLGYSLRTARNGHEALEQVRDGPLDLVILDVMMPGLDGWATLQRIRTQTSLPVIMLTALGDEPEVLRGFASGADDYVAKPFSFAQLAARIQAVLARSVSTTHPEPDAAVLQVGSLRLDLGAHRVTRDGHPLDLTPTEFQLLVTFMEQPGQVLSPRHLVARVWGAEYVDDTDYIRRYVWHLRQKLEPDPRHPCFIENVRGVGYRLRPAQESITPSLGS